MKVNYVIQELDDVPYVVQQILDDTNNDALIDESPVDLGTYLKVTGQQGVTNYLAAITIKIAQINSTFKLDPADPQGMLALAQCINNIAQNIAAFAQELQKSQALQ